jgi:hypothetical protein
MAHQKADWMAYKRVVQMVVRKAETWVALMAALMVLRRVVLSVDQKVVRMEPRSAEQMVEKMVTQTDLHWVGL